MNILKTIYALIFLLFIFTIYENLMAFRDGIFGLTKKNGNEVGCVCHEFDPNDSVFVKIFGPANVEQNDTVIYQLKIANGPAGAGGCDIAVSLGEIYESSLDSSLKRGESFPGSGFELTHKYPKLFENDTLTFTFRYIAPDTFNVVDTLFANGNSVNHDTTSENDAWNYARNFTINVTPMSAVNNLTATAESFILDQNYPNPFNPETRISFSIKKASNISLIVFDITGKEVAALINNKYYIPGEHNVAFNAAQYGLTSGVYFYKLTSDNYSDVKRMMLIK